MACSHQAVSSPTLALHKAPVKTSEKAPSHQFQLWRAVDTASLTLLSAHLNEIEHASKVGNDDDPVEGCCCADALQESIKDCELAAMTESTSDSRRVTRRDGCG